MTNLWNELQNTKNENKLHSSVDLSLPLFFLIMLHTSQILITGSKDEFTH